VAQTSALGGLKFRTAGSNAPQYSNELKLEVVQAYLIGNESPKKIAEKYGIQNSSQVVAWVKKFKFVFILKS